MKYTREIKELNLKFEVDEEELVTYCKLAKTNKKVWAFRFNSLERMNKRIEEQIETTLAKKQAAQDRRDLKKVQSKETKETIKVGDVYLYTFSYENTYRTFYQVLEVKPKIKVRQLRVDRRDTSWASGYVTPVLNDFYGEEIIAKVSGKYLNIDRDLRCQKVDPKEEFYVSSGY
jgi:hypothetical protein